MSSRSIPIPEMLELLTNSLPDTPALLGTAEDIPLPDDSVDAVLVAQAWHWFDPERAIKEVARVLRPGGRLGLVWNTRDERLGWVKDLGRIIGHEDDPFNHEVPLPETVRRNRARAPGRVDELSDPAGAHRPRRIPQLLHHVAGRRCRTQTLERVRELLATHPALANANGLALPYITVSIRATLP